MPIVVVHVQDVQQDIIYHHRLHVVCVVVQFQIAQHVQQQLQVEQQLLHVLHVQQEYYQIMHVHLVVIHIVVYVIQLHVLPVIQVMFYKVEHVMQQ